MHDNGRFRLALCLDAFGKQLGRGFRTIAALACTFRQLSVARGRRTCLRQSY